MIAIGGHRNMVGRVAGGALAQGVRGGQDWLGGQRWPEWASPYNGSATAILMAAFPNHWAAIRTYGIQHPEIVPFVNEDPMLVCSLVECGVVRAVNGGGIGYFRTGVFDTPCDKTRFIFRYRRHATNDNGTFGTRQSYNSRGFIFTFVWNSAGNCGWNYGNGYSEKSGNSISINAFHEFDMDGTTGKLRVDGIEFMSRAVASGVNSYGEFLLIGGSWNGSSSATSIGRGDFAGGEMFTNGTLAHWYAPYKREGVYELIDLISGDIITRVGTFTIEYTDAAGNTIPEPSPTNPWLG